MTPGVQATLNAMRKAGIAITRDNYIACAYAGLAVDWDNEHEAELPKQLQDWSLFNSELVYTGPPVDFT